MNDVEDFLRRVAQMRAEAQAKAKQQAQRPAPQQPPARPQPSTVPPPRPVPQLVPTRQPIVEAEIVEAEIANRDDLIAASVREHLRGAEAIAQHTRSLGAEVDQADDKLAARLHEVFDHELGHLKKASLQTPAPQEQPPADVLTTDSIARLLRSPTAARDAVILAEILQRPETRW
jgi:hypothetical protein